LTWKCASRHSRIHFFDISTSKSAPTLRCFVHFDLEMRFAPHRRALFRHHNFLKCPEREVCLVLTLANALRAQRRATFHLSSGHMAPRRFSQPTIRPSGATNHWRKYSESRLSYLFTHLHLLSSDSFSSLIFSLLLDSTLLFSLTLPISAFHLSILSEV